MGFFQKCLQSCSTQGLHGLFVQGLQCSLSAGQKVFNNLKARFPSVSPHKGAFSFIFLEIQFSHFYLLKITDVTEKFNQWFVSYFCFLQLCDTTLAPLKLVRQVGPRSFIFHDTGKIDNIICPLFLKIFYSVARYIFSFLSFFLFLSRFPFF